MYFIGGNVKAVITSKPVFMRLLAAVPGVARVK